MSQEFRQVSPEQMTLSFIRKGKDHQFIHEKLFSLGLDAESICSLIERVKSKHYEIKRRSGSIWAGIGVAMLTLGSILSVIFYHQGIDLTVPLYVVTTLGLAAVIKGMIDILGW
jgi:hypothetical protein